MTSFRPIISATICVLSLYSLNPAIGMNEPPSGMKFEYQMSADDRLKLETAVSSLKKGMSLAEAKRRLGPPTEERIIYTKDLFGKGKFVSKLVTYTIKKVSKRNDNANDHVIALYFDQHDILMEAERFGYSKNGKSVDNSSAQYVEKIL